MPSPEQLAELQNPEILKAFFADVKTSEIQSRLDAINRAEVESRDEALEKLKEEMIKIHE